MIPRYTRPEMGRIWSDENRFQKWLEVELVTVEVLAEAGVVPPAAARTLRQRARVDVDRIQELEAQVRHDVIAFTLAVSESVGDAEAARWLHYGLTSNDVVDTALALLLRDASRLIDEGLARLEQVLERRAWEFKDTPQIGRTHGIHAEPITFGLKLANWYDTNRRNRQRFAEAAEQMRVGKIGGAVGNYTHLGIDIEERICQRLGLQPARIASQVVERDRHAHYLSTLALIAATVERFALEIRHLQRTEVREVEEPFAEGQRGSSAMPHKKNPVGCEQLCGLARLVRAAVQPALENVALWHERDISHSSVERVLLPDCTILVDYLLARIATILEGLRVFPERMRQNLESTGGLVFSGQLLQDLVAAGASREEAYRVVQQHALAAWEGGASFRSRVEADPFIRQTLGEAGIANAFDLARQLRYVDAVFARVFARPAPAEIAGRPSVASERR